MRKTIKSRRAVGLIFVLYLIFPIIVSALTTKEIQNAIDIGIRTKKQRHHGLALEDQTVNVVNVLINGLERRSGWATREEKGFSIELFTPITWIEQMAADATRDYKEFTQADVTADMKEPVLFVLVFGRRGKDYEHLFGESVHHVVLRSEDKRNVVQPTQISSFSDLQQNLFGAREEYVGKTVTFHLSDVERLRATSPDGEFFLTVIGDRSEKNFKIKKKHFDRLPMPQNIEVASRVQRDPTAVESQPQMRSDPKQNTAPEVRTVAPMPPSTHMTAAATDRVIADTPRSGDPRAEKIDSSHKTQTSEPAVTSSNQKTSIQKEDYAEHKKLIGAADVTRITPKMEILRVKELLGEPAAIMKSDLKAGIPASWEYSLEDNSVMRIYFRQGRVQSVYITPKNQTSQPKGIHFERIDQLRGQKFFITIPVYVRFVTTDPATYVDESKGVYYVQSTPMGLALEFRNFDPSKSKYGAIFQEPVLIREVDWLVSQTTLIIESVNGSKKSATLIFRFSSVDVFWKLMNQCFKKSSS